MIAPELNTVRLRLAAPVLEDVPALAAACSSAPDILRVLNRQGYDEDDAENYVRAAQESWALNTRYTWLLHHRGSLVGQLSLNRKGHDASAVIGYWLVPSARGDGLLSEAGTTVLNWGLSPLGGDLVRVVCAAYEWNSASARLAERLGFKEVGTREVGELGWNFRGRVRVAHLDRI